MRGGHQLVYRTLAVERIGVLRQRVNAGAGGNRRPADPVVRALTGMRHGACVGQSTAVVQRLASARGVVVHHRIVLARKAGEATAVQLAKTLAVLDHRLVNAADQRTDGVRLQLLYLKDFF